MVAVTAVFAAIAALLASSSVVRVLTPRLPLYRLKTVKLFNLGMSWKEFKATIRADVSLVNDNYIKADVHGVRIDMYYPTWDGQELTHIGHVRDQTKSELGKEDNNDNGEEYTQRGGFRGTSHNGKEKNIDIIENTPTTTEKKPLWSLRPRQPFEVTDDLSMTLFHLPPRIMANMLWSAVTKGRLVIPSTGVAHVRSTGGAHVTIGMICDNVVDVWSQLVVGRDCAVNGLTTGWINMDKEHQRLQKDAFQRHVKSTTIKETRPKMLTA